VTYFNKLLIISVLLHIKAATFAPKKQEILFYNQLHIINLKQNKDF